MYNQHNQVFTKKIDGFIVMAMYEQGEGWFIYAKIPEGIYHYIVAFPKWYHTSDCFETVETSLMDIIKVKFAKFYGGK